MTNFNLSKKERQNLINLIAKRLENYYSDSNTFRVSPELKKDEIISLARQFDFSEKIPLEKGINILLDGLEKFTVHTAHPMYYGLFNPRVNFASVLADWMTAVLNPQLAAWSHSPYAIEIENYLIHEFGKKFGYPEQSIDGTFATGGAEANLTAVLCALNHHFPKFANEGFFGLHKKPLIYCSSESHHSIIKAARAVGLGYFSVKNIATIDDLKIDISELEKQIEEDLQVGHEPFMLVGTAGTTGSGAIDSLPDLYKIATKHNLWFHIDAAYGGAAILDANIKNHLNGIDLSDSITFDVHKWLSNPMGTSLFLTSNPSILSKTFRVSADYMPREAKELAIIDPFTHSIQWSRRFNGLKLYLPLLFFGWDGYEEVIMHQTKMGELLKVKLKDAGWKILNDTPLPIVCFSDERFIDDPNFSLSVCQNIVQSGKSWISIYPIKGVNTLRACITNYDTQENDLDNLVHLLNQERSKFLNK